MIEVETRPAQESDREFAKQAHHAAYRSVVERQFGPWDELMQDRFFDEQWDPRRQQIIQADGIRCGYCLVEHRAHDIHLSELVIHPELQGRGIGTRSFNASKRRLPRGVFRSVWAHSTRITRFACTDVWGSRKLVRRKPTS